MQVARIGLALLMAGVVGACAGGKGDPGAQGTAGTPGTAGPAGDAGPQGAPGTGGPAGDAGPQGDPGTAGPAGDAGANGAAGPSGDAGVSTGKITVTVYNGDSIYVLGSATVTTIPASVSTSSDGDGGATLSSVPIGSYFVTANKTGYQADGVSVSVTAGGTATATLRLGKGATFALARVVGMPGDYTDQLPAGEKRMTLFVYSDAGPSVSGLDAGVNYTDIKTNALPNVQVNSYVYLRGAGEDSTGRQITTRGWSLAKPIGSNAALEYWDIDAGVDAGARNWSSTAFNTADVRFRADMVGTYYVTVDAGGSIDGGVYSSAAVTKVFAAHMVGVQECVGCHSNEAVVGRYKDVVAEWALTGHATKFVDYYSSYGQSTKMSDYCLGCHTTGYDESKSGGFDEMARRAGWKGPDGGVWDSNDPSTLSVAYWLKKTWPTIGDFVRDDTKTAVMQSLMNIQCESCHGPGSTHPSAEMHKSWDPGVCAQCHAQHKQWELSGHGKLPSPSEWGSSSCMPCHSGQGFVVSKIQGQPIVFPDQSFPGYQATVFEKGMIQPIGCVTCHDPHEGTGSKSKQLRREDAGVLAPMGFTVTAVDSVVCNMCHAGRRDYAYYTGYLDGGQSRGPHGNTQGEMLTGKSGAEYPSKTYGSSYHSTNSPKNECVTCHMYKITPSVTCTTNDNCAPGQACSKGKCADQYFGGHTFSMNAYDGGSTFQHVAACNQSGCHGGSVTTFDRATNSFTSNGGIQSYVDELLNKLAPAISWASADGGVPSSSLNNLSPKATKPQLQALWNYWYVKNDGSRGVHNSKYAVQLLCDSILDLDAGTCTRP